MLHEIKYLTRIIIIIMIMRIMMIGPHNLNYYHYSSYCHNLIGRNQLHRPASFLSEPLRDCGDKLHIRSHRYNQQSDP
jgi:hypothetical protein